MRSAVTVAILVALAAVDGRAQLLRSQLRSSDKGCTISATSLSFSSYDPLIQTPTDGQGTISYSCGTHTGPAERTPIKNVQIELSAGSSGSYDRSLSSGGERLRYNVYLDPAHQTIWGDGSSGTDVLRHSSPQNHQTYTVQVYGRILPQQDVATGTYVDALIATIQW